MRQTLSIATITLNEEANLQRTLDSVRWADEIVIVDSGSQDRTLDIAHSFHARTFFEPFRGHGEQKNVALDKCTCDWILLLDADEVVSPGLAKEIQQTLAEQPPCDAYWIPRSNLIFGRWMRHGGFYPDRKLRLFKRGAARLKEGVGPHSTPQCQGPTRTLRNDLLHYAYPNFDLYIEHMNRYSSDIAPLLLKAGKDSRSGSAFVWNTVLNPIATFIYNYVFRLGFLDGREGLLLHLNHSLYIHWKYVKAWRASQGKE